jgi:hypothetical protein
MVWKSASLISFKEDFASNYRKEIAFRIGKHPSEEPEMFSVTETPKLKFIKNKNVLLCTVNLYKNVPNGGGGTYKKVIETNPTLNFYSFTTSLDNNPDTPKNLTEITISESILTGDVLGGLLEAVAGSTFDFIDIPDWLTPQHSIRKKLEQESVTTSKIVAALHGSNSRVFATKPKSMRNQALVKFLRRKEQILYEESDYGYGFSRKYASSQFNFENFRELSSFPMCHVPIDTEVLAVEEERIIPVFLGRKEYTKGYDLFLNKIIKMPYFAQARIFAPNAFGREEYEDLLLVELENINHIALSKVASQEEIIQQVKNPNTLFIFPSRFDSFNLSFMQVLLAGGVVACSKNVNARLVADNLGLRYVEIEKLESIFHESHAVSELLKIKQENLVRLRELRELIDFEDESSFRTIYV